jgi:glycosyltransferase involved in cell wall biosynthesis
MHMAIARLKSISPYIFGGEGADGGVQASAYGLAGGAGRGDGVGRGMHGTELSILIPARNEMFLARTIEDAVAHIEADTEIIAVLDGAWAEPGIRQHPRVQVVHLETAVGQRAATNIAARLARGKYLMKVDAHCSFDQGFDRVMLEGFREHGDDVTAVPIMRNLWAFDWKCHHCGWKHYQGPTPAKCAQCGRSDKIKRKMMWVGKSNPQSTSYCFDAEPHFQYFESWKHRPEYVEGKKTGFTETMSLQGSCFMSSRQRYWDWELSDERLGNWGNQGIEVAVKTWLAGGRVLVNHRTWYAHMFRTQGGDFSFPWPASGRDTVKTKKAVRDLLWEGRWPPAKHRLRWLLEKFWPVPGWTDADLARLP